VGRRDGRDPARQPVHVVQQVNGVGDVDHPENGQQEIRHRLAERAHADARGPEEKGCQNLPDQFHRRAQPPAIIHQPHERNSSGTDDNGAELGEVIPLAQRDGRCQHGQIDGDAAQARDRGTVHLTGRGLVYDAQMGAR